MGERRGEREKRRGGKEEGDYECERRIETAGKNKERQRQRGDGGRRERKQGNLALTR